MSRQLREKEQETDGLRQKAEALRQDQRKLEKSRREVGWRAGRTDAFIKKYQAEVFKENIHRYLLSKTKRRGAFCRFCVWSVNFVRIDKTINFVLKLRFIIASLLPCIRSLYSPVNQF